MFGLFNQWFRQKPPASSVLVIEDNKADRLFIQRVLEKKNYIVFAVDEGGKGLAIAREREIDLIILDYFLPDMNGLKVCEFLKSSEKTRDVPVVFLTVVDGDKILDIYEAGAEFYLHKPVSANELLRLVATMARKKQY